MGVAKGRIAGFDALRGILMLLGIFVHAALPYQKMDFFPKPISDTTSSIFWDYLILFIHAFRMPLFFVLAGFFSALIISSKGIKGYIHNRLLRIVVPFIASLIVLMPLINFAVAFSKGVPISHFFGQRMYLNFSRLAHLWFLYYLILVNILFILLWEITPKAWAKKMIQATNRLTGNFSSSAIIIATGTLIVGAFIVAMGGQSIGTSMSFIPDGLIFITYFTFFVFGLIMYCCRNRLTELLSYWRPYLFIAVIMSFIYFYLLTRADNAGVTPLPAFCAALIAWLMIFGCSGLFLENFSHPKPVLLFLGNASYWTYLIHLPIVIILSVLLTKCNICSVAKFGMTTTITGIITLTTYQWLVRRTFIGVLLNGSKK